MHLAVPVKQIIFGKRWSISIQAQSKGVSMAMDELQSWTVLILFLFKCKIVGVPDEPATLCESLIYDHISNQSLTVQNIYLFNRTEYHSKPLKYTVGSNKNLRQLVKLPCLNYTLHYQQ